MLYIIIATINENLCIEIYMCVSVLYATWLVGPKKSRAKSRAKSRENLEKNLEKSLENLRKKI